MKLLKKMSFTKQESMESNSVITEEGGSQVDLNKELWRKEKQMRFLYQVWGVASAAPKLLPSDPCPAVTFCG